MRSCTGLVLNQATDESIETEEDSCEWKRYESP